MSAKKTANRWPVQDAKARFSELLETSLREGPQVVTRRGVETAVLVPVEEWHRLQEAARRGVSAETSRSRPSQLPRPARV